MREKNIDNMEPLLARLANDMRQTLHQVIGLLELTAEEPLSAGQLHNLSRCRASADQLLRTAADVSELASSEPPTPSNAPFSLAGAIGEVVDVMRLLAELKGLKLSCSLNSDFPDDIVADKDVIQDTLRRLLDNSIRFTDRGGIALSVASGTAPEEFLIFEVADTGSGMPAELLAAHCEPEVPISAGLGLPLIRKRLSRSGGRFTIVESNCEGTTVRISMPISGTRTGRAAPAIQLREDLYPPEDPSPLKLLVVEDSDDSFALFQAYVKGHGHRISRALNGALGVEMVKSGDYDLVVMDVHMPLMDGYTATRTIREWETANGRTRLPILLLSAEDVSRQQRMGALVGCSGYIAKPARKNEVLKALNYFGRH